MKKIFFYLIIIQFLNLYAQDGTQTIETCWVTVNNDLAKEGESNQFTKDVNLNTVLQQYGVISYKQALPFAKTPSLQLIYEISCTGDIINLISDLESDFGYYSNFDIHEEVDAVELYDPIDYMWYVHLNTDSTWLWHLANIEAPRAWDITRGDSTVKVAILDRPVDITHPDLASEIYPNFDPYDSISFTCLNSTPPNSGINHGTAVASFVSGETTDQGDVSNGQLSSVGYKTKMMFYKFTGGQQGVAQRALHASNIMGAKVITSSVGYFSSNNCATNNTIKSILKEILNNGTTIIYPAGNGNTGTTQGWCNGQPVAPLPFSPLYDERIILVSSTGIDNKHQFTSNLSGTHSHYPMVDLCSPGYNLFHAKNTDCSTNTWPYYGSGSGTSFATPIVAGVASLMYSVNNCLTPSWVQDILKHTTDPIVDATNFPGVIGTGRVNAYKAVKAARAAQSNDLDLYTKDHLEDFGKLNNIDWEYNAYDWSADIDNSPDIWVRKQNDGIEVQEHESPEYSSSSPAYVYVRVRNKSCVDASGNEKISLYWSKASTWSSWPDNWNGVDPNIGNKIGEINIGNLKQGKDSIYVFEWNVSYTPILLNWNTCLMSRIENSTTDIITDYPNRNDNHVRFNNNVAMKNITVTNVIPGYPVIGDVDGHFYSHGTFMYIRNTLDVEETFDFKFESPKQYTGNPITHDAEVKLIFQDDDWNLVCDAFSNAGEKVRVIKEGEVQILNPYTTIANLTLEENTEIPMYVSFQFLTDRIGDKNKYQYHIRQFLNTDSTLLGGEHFEINRIERPPFYANAGGDKILDSEEPITLSAIQISEIATYNWYNEEGELVHIGKDLTVAPEVSSKYKLEVIAETDGYKDYDDVKVKIISKKITSISPNPASNQISIEYQLEDSESAYIIIVNQLNTVANNYILNHQSIQTNLDISSYSSGLYNVILVCDGIATHNKSFIKI